MGLFRNKEKKRKERLAKSRSPEKAPSTEVRVIVWKKLSDDLLAIADDFTAVEVRDSDTVVYAINDEHKFKEDLSFPIDRAYEVLNYELELRGKKSQQKEGIIRRAIEKQEELIKSLEVKPQQNEYYNFEDEDFKLRQLRVLYDSLVKKGRGNYVRLGVNGIRQYEFVVQDGILFPYFFGTKITSAHPDLQHKKKVFNSENTIFNKEMSEFFNNGINWFGLIFLTIAVLVLAGNIFWSWKLYTTSEDMNMQINANALTCTNTLSQIQSRYGEILQDYLNVRRAEAENNANAPPSNPRGEININPSNQVNR